MQKDFITATPDSGGSGSTTVTVAASANQTESTRSTSLSVASSRKAFCLDLSLVLKQQRWTFYAKFQYLS